MRSPSGVPPGSRVDTTSRPSRSSRVDEELAPACSCRCRRAPRRSRTRRGHLPPWFVRIEQPVYDPRVRPRDRRRGLHRLARRRSAARARRRGARARQPATGSATTSPTERGSTRATSAATPTRRSTQREPDVCFHLAAQADVGTSVERPDARRRGERARHRARARGRPPPRRARRLHLHRRRALRRVRAPGDRGRPPRAARPLRRLEARRRGVPRRPGTASTAPATSSLRLANVFGPRQLAKLEGGVVAIFMQRLAADEPAQIFGDGEQTRDFVYVDDVVRALLAAAAHDGGGGVYNVGTGVGDLRERALASAAARSPARAPQPSTRPRDRVTCAAASSTQAARAASSAGDRSTTSATACAPRGPGRTRRTDDRDARSGDVRPARGPPGCSSASAPSSGPAPRWHSFGHRGCSPAATPTCGRTSRSPTCSSGRSRSGTPSGTSMWPTRATTRSRSPPSSRSTRSSCAAWPRSSARRWSRACSSRSSPPGSRPSSSPASRARSSASAAPATRCCCSPSTRSRSCSPRVYPEALFLALSAGAFAAAVRGRGWEAGLLGALAVATRPFGLALLAPLAYLLRPRARTRAELLRPAPLLLLPLPLALFAWHLDRRHGNPWLFLDAQSEYWQRHTPTLGPLGGLWESAEAAYHGAGQLLLPPAAHGRGRLRPLRPDRALVRPALPAAAGRRLADLGGVAASGPGVRPLLGGAPRRWRCRARRRGFRSRACRATCWPTSPSSWRSPRCSRADRARARRRWWPSAPWEPPRRSRSPGTSGSPDRASNAMTARRRGVMGGASARTRYAAWDRLAALSGLPADAAIVPPSAARRHSASLR